MILVTLLLASAAGAAYFWSDIEKRLKRTDVTTEPVSGGVLNMLVIGSDTRDGLSDPQDVKRFGRVGGRRADTIILVQAVPSEQRAVLVHFPRDLWVPIAGHGNGKINSAYGYGSQTVIDTVSGLTGIPVNHYIEVNISGFRNIVDAIGGIDVCVDHALRDSVLNFRMPAGPNHLGGNEALSFVRARHADPDGDFGRIRRQQQFLRAVVSKIGRKDVLLNPIRVRQLANAFASNVTTDRDLTLSKMLGLARNVHSVEPEQMRTFTVPGEVGRAGGQSAVIMDRERANVLFGALRAGEDPEKALAPEPIQVTVEDASGKGLGERVAQDLRGRGFLVGTVTQAPAVSRRTDVRTPRVRANDARQLIAITPGARLLYGGTEIKLVIGSSFRGLAKPQQGEAPRPGGPCAGFSAGA